MSIPFNPTLLTNTADSSSTTSAQNSIPYSIEENTTHYELKIDYNRETFHFHLNKTPEIEALLRDERAKNKLVEQLFKHLPDIENLGSTWGIWNPGSLWSPIISDSQNPDLLEPNYDDIRLILTPIQVNALLEKNADVFLSKYNIKDSEEAILSLREGLKLYAARAPQANIDSLFLDFPRCNRDYNSQNLRFNKPLPICQYGVEELLAKHVSLKKLNLGERVFKVAATTHDLSLARAVLENCSYYQSKCPFLEDALLKGSLLIAQDILDLLSPEDLDKRRTQLLVNLFRSILNGPELNSEQQELFLSFVKKLNGGGINLERLYEHSSLTINQDVFKEALLLLIQENPRNLTPSMIEKMIEKRDLHLIESLTQLGLLKDGESLIKELLDLEEKAWAEKLGTQTLLIEKENEQKYVVYYRYYNNVFKITLEDIWGPVETLENAEVLEELKNHIGENIRAFQRGNHLFGQFTKSESYKTRFTCDVYISPSFCQMVNAFKKKKIDFLQIWFEREHRTFEDMNLLHKVIEWCIEKYPDTLTELFLQARNPQIPIQKAYFKAFLANHVPLEKKEVATQVLRIAAAINSSVLTKAVFEKHPDLIDKEALSIAIQSRNFDYAMMLIHKNFPVNNSLFVLIQTLSNSPTSLEKDDEQSIFALISELLSQGDDPNRLHSIAMRFGEQITCSTLEYAYVNRGPNRAQMQKIAQILVAKGAKITPKMAALLMPLIKEGREAFYREFLIRDGYITQEELDIFLNPTIEGEIDLKKEAIFALQELRGALKRHNLNTSLISPKELFKIRNLKKQIKTKLEEGEKDPQLEGLYTELKKEWGVLVANHHLLSLIKEMKSLLNKGNWNRKFIRFFSLFSKGNHHTMTGAETNICDLYDKETGKTHWRAVVENVYKIANEHFEDPFFQFRTPIWFHGTKASCLPLMRRQNGILSLRSLLDQRLAPFAGELTIGREPNAHISGEMLTFDWEETPVPWLGATTRLIISLLYALQTKGGHLEEMGMIFNAEESWGRLTQERLELMLKNTSQSNLWYYAEIDILRLKMTDRDANEKLQSYKGFLEEAYNRGHNSENRSRISRLFKAIDAEIEVLSEEERRLIANPFPIVFASLSKDSIPYHFSRELPKGYEFIIEDRILFEEGGIDVAFTTEAHIEELKAILPPHIRVYNIDRALYLEMLQMTRGSAHKARLNAPLTIRLGEGIQRDIIPLYATPFPRTPHYKDKDRIEVELRRPFYGPGIGSYDEYISLINRGEIFPRHYHDPCHASRTTIWALMSHEIDKRLGSEAVDPFLLGVSAASHDVMREDEGEDRWDEESGEFLFRYFKSLGYSTKEIAPFVEALKDKDPQKRGEAFKTPHQRAVHNGDVFEILRCLRDPLNNFKKDQLTFSEKEIPGIDTDRLIEEVYDVIKTTEEQACKKWFHEESKNNFQDFVNVIFYIHEHIKPLPNIIDLLRPVLEPTPLNESLQAILQPKVGA